MRKYRSSFMLDIPFYPLHYFSHALILISVVISIAGFFFPDLKHLFGLHQISLGWDGWIIVLWQLVLYQFLHGDILHILMNSIFLYQAWPEIENRMSPTRFRVFFLLNTLFVAGALWFLAPSYSITIGISGFCMALLAYLWIDLHTTRHPMANQILVMLVINILLGFTGNISLIGHASGAVFGVLWWYLLRSR